MTQVSDFKAFTHLRLVEAATELKKRRQQLAAIQAAQALVRHRIHLLSELAALEGMHLEIPENRLIGQAEP